MTSISINTSRLCAIVLAAVLAACGADQGSRTGGVRLDFTAMPARSDAVVMAAGAKTFDNDLGDSITLDRAYLVISNIELETDCAGAPVFSLAPLLDMLVPAVHAHTPGTPTSTGDPYVIDVLAQDELPASVGSLNPLAADYCGLRITLDAADADATGLPVSVGVPNDMVGLAVYLEGSYNGPNPLQFATGAALPLRNMLLSPAVSLSADDRAATVAIGVHYDRWFDSIDLAAIDHNVLLQNIAASLHRR